MDRQGAYDEAEPLYEQSLSVYERSVGLVQPSVAAVYSNWAKLHEAKVVAGGIHSIFVYGQLLLL